MVYETAERLKSSLDTHQLHREQMCLALLAIDKRFSNVKPRHPHGGPDGGRDIEATFQENQKAFGAVGFVNGANDSSKQKTQINKKFRADLKSALNANERIDAFIFFTNLNLTITEQNNLIQEAKKNVSSCEIFDRERLRILLDSADGFAIRFQYLGISLSDAEQATFFAKWGGDIQSIISSGFQKIEKTLNRMLFLQEANNVLTSLRFIFELDRTYQAEEIGHFRAFCDLSLKEPKHDILSIIFGSSDKSHRIMRNNDKQDEAGIQYGISGGQWEEYIISRKRSQIRKETTDIEYRLVRCSSSIGNDIVSRIFSEYTPDMFIRLKPMLLLKDIDEARFLPIINASLAEKIKSIHIYANGYKLQKIRKGDFTIDTSDFDTSIPAHFTDLELQDKWVRIRPSNFSSCFHLSFFQQTPLRVEITNEITNE